MKAVVDQIHRPLSPAWLRWLVMFLLIVGIVFRFVNLNHKVYGQDEVYTSLRASGYTVQGVSQAVFQNQVFPAKELLRFQQPQPGSTPVDTVRSLAMEDPQQPPLYFLLDRLWVQALGNPIQALFGSPLTASRLLPALISLLSLPFMYALAGELFASQAVALLATAFLALSPFEILFAQTACQSSLLTLATLASHCLLLQASRLSDVPTIRSRDVLKRPPPVWQHWGLYTLTVTLGLYTHPLFALTLVGHAIVTMRAAIAPQQRKLSQRMMGFWLSLLAAVVLYAPWMVVLANNVRSALDTLQPTAATPSVASLAKRWVLSLTALFLDLDLRFGTAWTFGLRLLILGLLVWAFYTLYRRDDRASFFVLVATGVPLLALALPEAMLGSPRSTINRYWLLCYPGVQLAIAYFLATRLAPKPHYRSSRPSPAASSRFSLRLTPYALAQLNRWFWRIVLLALFAASLASCTLSAASNTWWHEGRSYFNATVADRVNAKLNPLLVSDAGEASTNLSDLISLSYRLNPNVRLLLLNNADWVATRSFTAQTEGSTIVAFHPSQPLKEALERSRGTLQPLLPEANVWQVPAP